MTLVRRAVTEVFSFKGVKRVDAEPGWGEFMPLVSAYSRTAGFGSAIMLPATAAFDAMVFRFNSVWASVRVGVAGYGVSMRFQF